MTHLKDYYYDKLEYYKILQDENNQRKNADINYYKLALSIGKTVAQHNANAINYLTPTKGITNKSMTKKELQFQIDAAFAKLDEITKKVNYFHSRLDKVYNRLNVFEKEFEKSDMEISEDIGKEIKAVKDTQSNRYSMLLDYLKVQEEEYAELQKETESILGRTYTTKSEAVKKTRLIPVKKK